MTGVQTCALPILMPVTAALITGERAVVYVAVSGKEGVFEGRDVVLGPRAGDYYVVKSGLEEGEQVVVNGNFKIDSELQIRAKPSMMYAEAEDLSGQPLPDSRKQAVEVYDTDDTFKRSINEVFEAYLPIHSALSRDDLDKAKKAAEALNASLDRVNAKWLKAKAYKVWIEDNTQAKKAVEEIRQAKNIGKARQQFERLSDSLYNMVKQFGIRRDQKVLRFYCPMAFDFKGAYWLQRTEKTENPYFGSQMFRCGEVVETVADLSK